MYKALSNIKSGGKLYVKGDEISLEKKLAENLAKEGIVEIIEETKAEKEKAKKKEKEAIADAKKKADEKIKAKKKEYENMNEDKLKAIFKEREIEHKNLSRKDAIKALERSDRVRDESN